MSKRLVDQLHTHKSIMLQVRAEYSEDGRLHRHRVHGSPDGIMYSSWAHNTESHQHRLPDGAWTRPRTALNPPELVQAAVL
jgi:hypothetical protein